MKLARKTPCSWLRVGAGPDTQADPPPWRRMRASIDGYGPALLGIVAEAYGKNAIQRAWRAFNLTDCDPFLGEDPHTELFFAWLFHRWSPRRGEGRKGITPTQVYLTLHGGALDPLQRRYLEACLATPFGFYEVLDCKRSVGLVMRDMLSGQVFEVSEGLASTTLKRGDVVFAHVVPVDGVALIKAISPVSFPLTVKGHVEELRKTGKRRRQADFLLRQLYFRLLPVYGRMPAPDEDRDGAGEMGDGGAPDGVASSN